MFLPQAKYNLFSAKRFPQSEPMSGSSAGDAQRQSVRGDVLVPHRLDRIGRCNAQSFELLPPLQLPRAILLCRMKLPPIFAVVHATSGRVTMADQVTDAPTMVLHGAMRLPTVEVNSYNIETKDDEGYVGDRASKGAF